MRTIKLIKITFASLLLAACNSSVEEGPVEINEQIVTNNYSALENYEKVTGGAEIVFNELVHDFGTVIQGEPLHYSFYFVNSGDQPLVLTKVQGSCGCTIPSKPEEAIAPGEKAKIDVVVNTEKKPLDKFFVTYITVESNAKSAMVKLKVSGIPTENKN